MNRQTYKKIVLQHEECVLWSLGVDCSFSTLRPLWFGDNLRRLNWAAHWQRLDVDFKVFGQVPSEEVLGGHGHPDVKLCLAINIFMSASSRYIPSLSSWSNGDLWLFLEKLIAVRYHLQRAANVVSTKWDTHVALGLPWWVKKGKFCRMLWWKGYHLWEGVIQRLIHFWISCCIWKKTLRKQVFMVPFPWLEGEASPGDFPRKEPI